MRCKYDETFDTSRTVCVSDRQWIRRREVEENGEHKIYINEKQSGKGEGTSYLWNCIISQHDGEDR